MISKGNPFTGSLRCDVLILFDVPRGAELVTYPFRACGHRPFTGDVYKRQTVSVLSVDETSPVQLENA